MIYFADTSAILNGVSKQYNELWISPLVITELEKIKNSERNEHIKYLAREAVRDILFSNYYKIFYYPQQKVNKLIKKYKYLSNINDHHLLCEALILSKEQKQAVTFITSDGALALFARLLPNIQCEFFQPENKSQEEYCGWHKFNPSEIEMSELYSHPENNILRAQINEFCEIYEHEELKDILFWNGSKYRPLNYKEFKSVLGEKIHPRNLEQKMYMDLLQNKEVPIKLCTAKFGTGKSFLALTYALHEIQQGNFDKIIFVKNNLEVKGAGKLGTLPGDEIQKQYPWLRQIEDIIGIQKFEEYLDNGTIEPAHLSTLRGRDLKNSIILVDEAENLLATNIQLLLGRVAENSEIIFCADVKQCDYEDEKKSGIPKMIKRLAGNPLFGMVKLIKTERSAIAATADLLD